MAVPEKIDPKIWRVVAVVLIGPFMTQLDSTVVNFSLSTIQADLHSTVETAQWIITGYLLSLALMLPLNAWMVDRVGAKKLYLACFSAFTLASVLCGQAVTIQHLIYARLLQGMAGGLLAPMTQMMIAQVAGKQMARVIGYAAVPVLLGPVLGPILAGAILKNAGWPWLFYLNLPIGIIAVLLAAYLLPNDDASIRKRPFDFLGFFLISPGLVCILYGFGNYSKEFGQILLALGLILIGGFTWDAFFKKEKALIDLRLFHHRTFLTASITQFLSNGVLYAGQMLIPLYLISGAGFSTSRASWMLIPTGVGMMCVYPIMGLLTEKLGCRAVSVSGVILNTVGTLPFLWMIHSDFSPGVMVVCMILRGAGQGMVGIPSVSAAYASVPKEKLSSATTAMNVVQRIGGPTATTGLAIVIARSMGASGPEAYFAPFGALIILQLLVLISASGLPVRVHTEA